MIGTIIKIRILYCKFCEENAKDYKHKTHFEDRCLLTEYTKMLRAFADISMTVLL